MNVYGKPEPDVSNGDHPECEETSQTATKTDNLKAICVDDLSDWSTTSDSFSNDDLSGDNLANDNLPNGRLAKRSPPKSKTLSRPEQKTRKRKRSREAGDQPKSRQSRLDQTHRSQNRNRMRRSGSRIIRSPSRERSPRCSSGSGSPSPGRRSPSRSSSPPRRRLYTPPRFESPYLFKCVCCTFKCELIAERISHTSTQHPDLKYSCKICRKFSAFDKFTVEMHLKRLHKCEDYSNNIVPPSNPREVACLLCIEENSEKEGIWKGRDVGYIIDELKNHLRMVHVKENHFQDSFIFRCGNCSETFPLSQNIEWSKHVQSHF